MANLDVVGGFGYGTFGGGPFGFGDDAGALEDWTPKADRFGFGRFGGYYEPIIDIPDLIPDRLGLGCYGRRWTVPFTPVGKELSAVCYLTIGRVGSSGSLVYTQAGEPSPAAPTILPRLRAPVVYVLDANRKPIAVIDGYESFEWEDRWRDPDEWALRINIHVQGAKALAVGEYIAVPLPDGTTRVGVIEVRGLSVEGHEDSEVIEASGRCYGKHLEGRIAMMKTAEGDGYDRWTKTKGSAADAMCHYVWSNVIGDEMNPVGWRVIPNLEIGTIPATADRVAYNARFQPLTEILHEIGMSTGLGWQVRYDGATRKFRFEPQVGRDMTREVVFNPTYGNVSSIGFVHNTRNARTVAYVAGQGEGAEREVVAYYDARNGEGGGPYGLEAREMFVDARDIEPESRDTLETRGYAKLAEAPIEQAIEFELLNGGPYEYPRDFIAGDVVRAEYPDWAHEEARVIAVGQRWDEDGRSVFVTVGTEQADVGSVVTNLARRQSVRGRA